MFNFGASKTVDYLPDSDARAWVASGLHEVTKRLGAPAQRPRLLTEAELPKPDDLDAFFEFVCAVQAEVGQDDVEFTLLELDDKRPELPTGFSPLGNPEGQLLHTFHRDGEYIILYAPAVFRLPELVIGSVARELGRIGIHRAGGHTEQLEADDYEADAELAGIALGMGVWVANGAYVFENACCGGGCGIDLSSVRAGLSMPEACFGLTIDMHRKDLPRRAATRHLAPTQTAALKRSWSFWRKEQKALARGQERAALAEGKA